MSQDISQPSEMTLRDYLAVLRRRRLIMVLSVVGVIAAAVLYILLVPRVYESTASLLIEGSAPNYARRDASDPFGDLYGPPQSHSAATQMQVLQSANLLVRAFREAGVSLGAVDVKAKQQVAGTDVVTIFSDSSSPAAAYKVARTLPLTYLHYTADLRSTELASALAFAQARLEAKNKELIEAELALQRFKEKANIADLDKQRAARIAMEAKTASDVRQIQIDLNGAAQQYQALRAERAAAPLSIATPSVVSNPRVDEISRNIALLRTQRASALVLYKPADAKIKTIDAQLADQKALLAMTPATVTRTMRVRNPVLSVYDQKIAEAGALVAARRAQLARALATAAGAPAALNRFNVLESEQAMRQRTVDELRSTVALLATNVEGLTLRSQAIHPPAVMISAAAPAELVTPNIKIVLLLAVLLGLLVSPAMAFVHESLDSRIFVPEDAQRILEAPILGYVPQVKIKGEWLYTPPYVARLLESYRILRTNLQFAAANAPSYSLLVSSTGPGEGKTLTASNLAVVTATAGKRVVLVDADLRAPSIHDQFELCQQPGLRDVLVGEASLAESLQDTAVPGLRVLTAGIPPPNPGELLNSPAMSRVHQELKEMADVVIFDSPPLLNGSDSQVLSSEADGVVYVVQIGKVTTQSLRYAADLLRRANAQLLGMVFNKTSEPICSYYGYDWRISRAQIIPLDLQQRQQDSMDWSKRSILKHVILAASPSQPGHMLPEAKAPGDDVMMKASKEE